MVPEDYFSGILKGEQSYIYIIWVALDASSISSLPFSLFI
jgi:hypothetical protein